MPVLPVTELPEILEDQRLQSNARAARRPARVLACGRADGAERGVLDGTKIRSWQPPKEVSGPWRKKLFRSSPTSNKSLGMVLNLLRWVWMLNYPSLIRPSCTFRILDVFVGFGLIPHISPCRYHSRNFNSGWCSTGHWQIGRAEGCKMVRWTLIGESLLTPEK